MTNDRFIKDMIDYDRATDDDGSDGFIDSGIDHITYRDNDYVNPMSSDICKMATSLAWAREGHELWQPVSSEAVG